MEYQFKTNINCGGCIAKIAPYINANKGIQKWKVDTANPAKILTIETENLSGDEVKQIVETAGFKAEAVNSK